jgi:ribonuclease HI
MERSFVEATGQGSVEMVARNHGGNVMPTIGQNIQLCANANEVEIAAVVVQVRHLTKLCAGSIVINTDSASFHSLPRKTVHRS